LDILEKAYVYIYLMKLMKFHNYYVIELRFLLEKQQIWKFVCLFFSY